MYNTTDTHHNQNKAYYFFFSTFYECESEGDEVGIAVPVARRIHSYSQCNPHTSERDLQRVGMDSLYSCCVKVTQSSSILVSCSDSHVRLPVGVAAGHKTTSIQVHMGHSARPHP